MEANSSGNHVIRFPGPRAAPFSPRDQRALMDTVYHAGSIVIAAEDRQTKVMATRLAIFGFVALEEIGTSTPRPLKPSEAIHAATDHPWRIRKPSGSIKELSVANLSAKRA